MIYLVPDIHDLQTGGNVYNRRMVEELDPEWSVRVVPWAPVDAPPPHLDGSEADVIVIDSLLARTPDAMRAVWEARPNSTLVLLAHYLHCIDPNADDAETATAERAALDVFDGVVTTSRFTKRALTEEGVSRRRIKVVPPGLDERYREPLPARSGRSVPRMLTVGNLLPEKGLGSFVEVLRDLRSVPWKWVLVGDASLDSEYADSVIERIREAGLSERVMHTGAVSPEDLPTWYDRADLFVLPSPFETLSMSTREAMARGLPVVAYRAGGVEENFGSAAAGRLVAPGDSNAFRSALEALLSNSSARSEMGRAGRRRSKVFPSWPEAARRFREALDELVRRFGANTRSRH